MPRPGRINEIAAWCVERRPRAASAAGPLSRTRSRVLGCVRYGASTLSGKCRRSACLRLLGGRPRAEDRVEGLDARPRCCAGSRSAAARGTRSRSSSSRASSGSAWSVITSVAVDVVAAVRAARASAASGAFSTSRFRRIDPRRRRAGSTPTVVLGVRDDIDAVAVGDGAGEQLVADRPVRSTARWLPENLAKIAALGESA